MNPMHAHPMSMDRMIFELKASIFATSLYLLICSHLDEGERPTLNNAREAWNGTEENLVQAAVELMERRVLASAAPLDFDQPLFVNPREKWLWCNRQLNRRDELTHSN